MPLVGYSNFDTQQKKTQKYLRRLPKKYYMQNSKGTHM